MVGKVRRKQAFDLQRQWLGRRAHVASVTYQWGQRRLLPWAGNSMEG